MKKILISLSTILATLVFASGASATLIFCEGPECPEEGYYDRTWTDTLTWEPAEYIGVWGEESYTHDITDGVDGFKIGSDIIESYTLTVGLHDDRDCWWDFELAHIDQPGLFADGVWTSFSVGDVELGYSLAGLWQINATGGLDVQVRSWIGDFYLDSSELVAEGCSPVPEPATMLLFGTGLAGFAGRRFRKQKKA